jgi:glycosyltransferase involved in cell wall biosynthesis
VVTAQRIIALLGRRDEPTDALQDYCRLLGKALRAHNFHLDIRRVPWSEHGWARSLEALRLQAKDWRGTWVLVQYTALAWSSRGFPRRLLKVLHQLKKSESRIAVVFHDAETFGGARILDRFRSAAQARVMRAAVALSDRAVFTVMPEQLSWPDADSRKYSFIPVGANLPFPISPQHHESIHSPPTIAVFSITGAAAGDRETRNIIAATRYAALKLGNLRLLVFGRHAETRERELREGLRDAPVDLDVCGVIEDQELVQRFSQSDVLLFVRGTISSRRGSAIAGIACGVPVIALQGKETASPITDAGVILLPQSLDETKLQAELGNTLVHVLSDNDFRLQLVRRSHAANEEFFSWPAIATKYADFLLPRA